MSAILPAIRIAAFVLFSIATGGVIVGVYWENEKFPKDKQDRGWRLLLWSLAFEVIFSNIGFMVDSAIAAEQQDKIIRLEARTKPRWLLPADRTALAKELQPLALVGTKGGRQLAWIGSYADVGEGHEFAKDIFEMLREAGWDSEWMPADKYGTAPKGIVGVFVQPTFASGGMGSTAAMQLTIALKKAQIAVVHEDGTEEGCLEGASSLPWGEAATPAKGLDAIANDPRCSSITIFVGVKP